MNITDNFKDKVVNLSLLFGTITMIILPIVFGVPNKQVAFVFGMLTVLIVVHVFGLICKYLKNVELKNEEKTMKTLNTVVKILNTIAFCLACVLIGVLILVAYSVVIYYL